MHCVIEHRGLGFNIVPCSCMKGDMPVYPSQDAACHDMLINAIPYSYLTFINFFTETPRGYRYDSCVPLKLVMEEYCERINKGMR